MTSTAQTASAAKNRELGGNAPPYVERLESGPWFEVGGRVDPPAAWQYLRSRAKEAAGVPYCIYVHVPYCASICRFCALYTMARPKSDGAEFDEFVDLLCRAIVDHPQAKLGHAPTTVHFGGGTPLHIGTHRLGMLVSALRASFGDSPACEWALEMTSRSADGRTLAVLYSLGFRRIHFGVQTLDDRIRAHNGLPDKAEEVLAALRLAVDAGFNCSVDLIMGFPGAEAESLCAEVLRLHDVGVRMFSICELRHRKPGSVAPSRAAEKQQGLLVEWLALWQCMSELGLETIHLGQFARSQTDNLYFTHPARNEDCIALGPYANGSAGNLHYANRLLPDYFAAIRDSAPTMASAVLYGDATRTLRGLERELLAHKLTDSTLAAVAQHYPAIAALLDAWKLADLVCVPTRGQEARLTALGSWYVGNMVLQARELAEGP